MCRVSNCIRDSIRIARAQPTEWQHIGNQINDAMVFAWADFVSVHLGGE
jgi:hypothetical protein